MAEVTVTLKGHGGYDAPWIVVRGDTAQDVSATLQELHEMGAFEATKTLAQGFIDAKALTPEQAEANIREVFPGAQEVTPSSGEIQQAAPAATPSGPVQQAIAPCPACGKPRTLREGRHPVSGPWAAYVCESGERSHTEFLK